ncbi:hypothetical protein KDA14_02185 [Candidatus Saccharibacteria bacterium]|nr:hypothetical protein [Candidatus Saccharibacteria bacterium]
MSRYNTPHGNIPAVDRRHYKRKSESRSKQKHSRTEKHATDNVDENSSGRMLDHEESLDDGVTVDELVRHTRNTIIHYKHPLDCGVFSIFSVVPDLISGIYDTSWDVLSVLLYPIVFKVMEKLELIQLTWILITLTLFMLGLTYIIYGMYAVTVSMHTYDTHYQEASLFFAIIVATLTILYYAQSELYPRWNLHVTNDKSPAGDMDIFSLKFSLLGIGTWVLLLAILGSSYNGFYVDLPYDDDDGRFIVYEFDEQTLTPATDPPSSFISPTSIIERTTLSSSDDLIPESDYIAYATAQFNCMVVVVLCIAGLLSLLSHMWVYIRYSPLSVKIPLR